MHGARLTARGLCALRQAYAQAVVPGPRDRPASNHGFCIWWAICAAGGASHRIQRVGCACLELRHSWEVAERHACGLEHRSLTFATHHGALHRHTPYGCLWHQGYVTFTTTGGVEQNPWSCDRWCPATASKWSSCLPVAVANSPHCQGLGCIASGSPYSCHLRILRMWWRASHVLSGCGACAATIASAIAIQSRSGARPFESARRHAITAFVCAWARGHPFMEIACATDDEQVLLLCRLCHR